MTSYGLLVRRAIAAVTLVCSAALATGCSGGASPAAAGPTTTVTTTVQPTAPASSGAVGSTGSAQAGSPAVSAGPQPCATSALRAAIGSGQGAAGSRYFPIDLTNISGTSCTLFGYPGVSFVTGAGGSQIGAAATRSPSTAKLVTLPDGATAHAVLQVVDALNYPAARCSLTEAHWLKIYPPNQFSALYLSFSAQTCAGGPNATKILSVQTVQPGVNGP
jgi:Domain of unknown function (DUF4232)